MLDLSTRLVVIVGGGAVAARKARGLIDAGAARVRVVAPTFADAMPPAVERLAEEYRPAHLDGATLVFAATDRPHVNAAVVQDAHRLGLLVNRADVDDENPGDFATPATLREGDLILTVSAGGAPALAAAIRDRLARHLDPKWMTMAAVTKEYRPQLIARDAPPDLRRAVFKDLATDDAMDVLHQQGRQGLADWLKERHPSL